MNKDKYLKARQELLMKAEGLIAEGKLEEVKDIRSQIEKLDNDFEAAAKAMADINALKGSAVGFEALDKGNVVVPSAVVVGDMTPVKAVSESDMYKNAFAKTMMGLELGADEKVVFDKINTEFRATVQTAATHTVLVPETTRDAIWQEIGEAHPILAALPMTFVKGDLTIIRETTAVTDGAWTDEDTATAETNVGFGELNLTGCELVKDITVSWKLKKMSVDAFLAYISSKIAEKMGNALAKAVVEGLGKPGEGDTHKAQPLGIAVALEAEDDTPQVVTYNTTDDKFDYEKLVDAFAVIKSGYLSGAEIYAKNSVIWGLLAKLKDSDGRALLIPDVTAGVVGRIFGTPVKEEDAVSADEILVANVRQGYAMNVNENMTMYQEEHVKARTTDYMGYMIVDGAPITTKAFALIKKSS